MTKLYLSGGIQKVLDHRIFFSDAQTSLEQYNYEVVNPIRVPKCLGYSCTQELDLPRVPKHTWECCLKYDLIEMLQCDGVAVLLNFLESKGAMLEVATARAVGITVKPVNDWILDALNS